MKIILLLFFIAMSAVAYQDVGDIATTYPIAEEDIFKQLRTGIENLDQNKLIDSAIGSAKDAYRSDAPFGGCVSEVNKSERFTVKSLGQYNLSGEMTVLPGTRITPQMEMDETVCVVDASDPKVFQSSLRGFKKRGIECTIMMISGRGIDEVASNIQKQIPMYPYQKVLGETLEFECMPTAMVIGKGKKQTVEFNAKGKE